jgi:hypothetical protein
MSSVSSRELAPFLEYQDYGREKRAYSYETSNASERIVILQLSDPHTAFIPCLLQAFSG